MTIDNQKLEFLRAKMGALILQVMEEEGIKHGAVYITIHDVPLAPLLETDPRKVLESTAVTSKIGWPHPELTLFCIPENITI